MDGTKEKDSSPQVIYLLLFLAINDTFSTILLHRKNKNSHFSLSFSIFVFYFNFQTKYIFNKNIIIFAYANSKQLQ